MEPLLAQTAEHGPGMHGPVLIVLLIVLVLVGLSAGVVKAIQSWKRPDKRAGRDQEQKRDTRT